MEWHWSKPMDKSVIKCKYISSIKFKLFKQLLPCNPFQIKDNILSICTVSLLFVLVITGCKPKMEEYRHGVINKATKFGVRNLTIVEIIPANSSVDIWWKGFDTLTGSVFKIGYEEIIASDSSSTYFITDRSCGNNRLDINGVKYSFDSRSQHLIIQFGNGIKIGPGAGHSAVNHVYDDNPF
jgi:hypothetical protein